MTGHVLAYLKGKVNILVMQKHQTTFLKIRKEGIFVSKLVYILI